MAKANPTTASSKLKLNVIIVGAGIGGMAAATALGRRGHNVTVFEDAPQIGEVLQSLVECQFTSVGRRGNPSLPKPFPNSQRMGVRTDT